MFNNVLINKKFISFFEENLNFQYLKDFHESNLIFDESNFMNYYGYDLFMKTPVIKFNKNFRLGKLGF